MSTRATRRSGRKAAPTPSTRTRASKRAAPATRASRRGTARTASGSASSAGSADEASGGSDEDADAGSASAGDEESEGKGVSTRRSSRRSGSTAMSTPAARKRKAEEAVSTRSTRSKRGRAGTPPPVDTDSADTGAGTAGRSSRKSTRGRGGGVSTRQTRTRRGAGDTPAAKRRRDESEGSDDDKGGAADEESADSESAANTRGSGRGGRGGRGGRRATATRRATRRSARRGKDDEGDNGDSEAADDESAADGKSATNEEIGDVDGDPLDGSEKPDTQVSDPPAEAGSATEAAEATRSVADSQHVAAVESRAQGPGGAMHVAGDAVTSTVGTVLPQQAVSTSVPASTGGKVGNLALSSMAGRSPSGAASTAAPTPAAAAPVPIPAPSAATSMSSTHVVEVVGQTVSSSSGITSGIAPASAPPVHAASASPVGAPVGSNVAPAALVASSTPSSVSVHDATAVPPQQAPNDPPSRVVTRGSAVATHMPVVSRAPTSAPLDDKVLKDSLRKKSQHVAHLMKNHRTFTARAPRLPEPQRPKAQWDFLLEESTWMANDFEQEELWKRHVAGVLARACVARVHQLRQQGRLSTESGALASTTYMRQWGVKLPEHDIPGKQLAFLSCADPSALAQAKQLSSMVRSFWATAQQHSRRGPISLPKSSRGASVPAATAIPRRGELPINRDVVGLSVEGVIARARAVLAHMFGGARTDMAEAPATLVPRLNEVGMSMLSLLPAPAAPSIRMYQAVAFRWLDAMNTSGLNAILSDDRGLGKRLVCLCAVLHRAIEARAMVLRQERPATPVGAAATAPAAEGQAGVVSDSGGLPNGAFHEAVAQEARQTISQSPVGPSLVVAPSELVLHWEMEVRRWCPDLHPAVFTAEQKVPALLEDGTTPAFNASHVLIVSPSVVRSGALQDLSNVVVFNVVIADSTVSPFLPSRQPASSEIRADGDPTGPRVVGVRRGAAMPFQDLAYSLDAKQRIVLVNEDLSKRLTQTGPLAQFIMPYAFNTEEAACKYCVSVVGPDGRAASKPKGPLSFSSEIESVPLCKALETFCFRRRAAERDMAAQLPARRVRALLCRMPAVQMNAVEAVLDEQKFTSVVADAATGLEKLVHALSRVHAAVQTSRVDACTGEVICPARSAYRMPALHAATGLVAATAFLHSTLSSVKVAGSTEDVYTKIGELAPLQHVPMHTSVLAADLAGRPFVDVTAYTPEKPGEKKSNKKSTKKSEKKSRSKEVSPDEMSAYEFPYQYNALRCGNSPLFGKVLLEFLSFRSHKTIVPSDNGCPGIDDVDTNGDSCLTSMLGTSTSAVALGGHRSIRRLWVAMERLVKLTIVAGVDKVLVAAPRLPAFAQPRGVPVIDGVSLDAGHQQFDWAELQTACRSVVGLGQVLYASSRDFAAFRNYSHLHFAPMREMLCHSGKLVALVHLLDDAKKNGTRMLIITSAPGVADDICSMLSSQHRTYLRLDRSIDSHHPPSPEPFGVLCSATVDRFNRDPRIMVGVACVVGVEDSGKLTERIAPLALEEDATVAVGAGLGGPPILGADMIVQFDVALDAGAAQQRAYLVDRIRCARETRLVQLVGLDTIEQGMFAAAAPAGEIFVMSKSKVAGQNLRESKYRDTMGLTTDLLRKADLTALVKGQYTVATDPKLTAPTAATPALRAAFHSYAVQSGAPSFIASSANTIDEFRMQEAQVFLDRALDAQPRAESPTSVTRLPVFNFARQHLSKARFGSLYPAVARGGHSIAGIAGAKSWTRVRAASTPASGVNTKHLHIAYEATGERARYTARSYVPFDHLGIGIRRQIAWHQEQLVMHYSHVYGPPHPDDHRVHAPPAALDEPVVASAARQVLADTEPALLHHVAPSRRDYLTSSAEIEKEAERATGVPPNGQHKRVLPVAVSVDQIFQAHSRKTEIVKKRKADMEALKTRFLDQARRNQTAARAAAAKAAQQTATRTSERRAAAAAAAGAATTTTTDGAQSAAGASARQSSSQHASRSSSHGGLYAWDPWTSSEDALLQAAVRKFGTNWDLVRDFMSAQPLRRGQSHHRSSRQCFDRHRKLLGPSRSHSSSVHSRSAVKRPAPSNERTFLGQGHNSLAPALELPKPSFTSWQMRLDTSQYPVAQLSGLSAADSSGEPKAAKRARTDRIKQIKGLAPRSSAPHNKKGMSLAASAETDDVVSNVDSAMKVKEPLPPAFGFGYPVEIAAPHDSHRKAVEAALEGARAGGALRAPSQVADDEMQAAAAKLRAGGQSTQRRVEPFRKTAPYMVQAQQARANQEAYKQAAQGQSRSAATAAATAGVAPQDAASRGASARRAAKQNDGGEKNKAAAARRRQADTKQARSRAAARSRRTPTATKLEAVAPAQPPAAPSPAAPMQGSAPPNPGTLSQADVQAQLNEMMQTNTPSAAPVPAPAATPAARVGQAAAVVPTPGAVQPTVGTVGGATQVEPAAVPATAPAPAPSPGVAPPAAAPGQTGMPLATSTLLYVIAQIPEIKSKIQVILARADLTEQQKVDQIAALLKASEATTTKAASTTAAVPR